MRLISAKHESYFPFEITFLFFFCFFLILILILIFLIFSAELLLTYLSLVHDGLQEFVWEILLVPEHRVMQNKFRF